jgi:hypothetical protein
MTAPDTNAYRVAYVREEITPTPSVSETPAVSEMPTPGVERAQSEALGEAMVVPRGKYLVDSGGRPTYLVDPGVCGNYPQRVEPMESRGASIAVPVDAPVELGIDRQPYRRVELNTAAAGVEPGTYLVNEGGEPVYRVRPTSKFDAPKAQLFRLIIDGTLGGSLPWGLVLIGVFLAILMELVGVSSLPFAVGLYLNISTSGGVFTGGVVRWLVDRKRKNAPAAEAEFSPGMLMASGLIAGGAITGVLQSLIAVREAEGFFDLSGRIAPLSHNGTWWPLFPFLGLAFALYLIGKRGKGAA